MKIRFVDGRFVLSSGVRVKTDDRTFDDILSLFFAPNPSGTNRRTRSIRFE